jgi:hypothetical protein
MLFQEVLPISREEANAGLDSIDPGVLCNALVRVTYHDPDWRWVQTQCMRLAAHSDKNVRGLAVSCLGHLARIHGVLDTEEVLPLLNELLTDPEVAPRAEDALDDIKTFLKIDLKV